MRSTIEATYERTLAVVNFWMYLLLWAHLLSRSPSNIGSDVIRISWGWRLGVGPEQHHIECDMDEDCTCHLLERTGA